MSSVKTQDVPPGIGSARTVRGRAEYQVIGGAAEWASRGAMTWPSRKYVVLHD
jgi:hypothetical protein